MREFVIAFLRARWQLAPHTWKPDFASLHEMTIFYSTKNFQPKPLLQSPTSLTLVLYSAYSS